MHAVVFLFRVFLRFDGAILTECCGTLDVYNGETFVFSPSFRFPWAVFFWSGVSQRPRSLDRRGFRRYVSPC